MCRLGPCGVGLLLSLGMAVGSAAEPAPWHTGLYLGNGGAWGKRVSITIRNGGGSALAGEVVEIPVGKAPGQVDLVGEEVRTVRVCSADGGEFLYRLNGPDGKVLSRGTIAAGSVLTVPVECAAHAQATAYVYWENADAWEVPDFLEGKPNKAKGAAVTVGPVESFPLRVMDGRGTPAGGAGPYWRVPVRVANFGASPTAALVSVDVTPVTARPRAMGKEVGMSVVAGGRLLDSLRLGGAMLFEAELPAASLQTFFVDVRDASDDAADVRRGFGRLAETPANRVNNGGFEAGGAAAAGWTVAGNAQVGRESPGLFGISCARVLVPQGAKGWSGLTQNVPVTAGKKYLYAGWVKCRDVGTRKLQLHAHWRRADGELCARNAMSSAGAGEVLGEEWTPLSAVLKAPADAATFQVHLTTNAPGTIWYDGVVVAEVVEGLRGLPETRMGGTPGGLAVWGVNPIVKVFREDLPASGQLKEGVGRPEVRISAARNEWEPVQLAVRSATRIEMMSVTVDPPTNAGGAQLDGTSVAVVSYVPVDYKTNYYRSDAAAWRRKLPTAAGSCDGWAGWWPDPLLPASSFELPAEQTQPVWVTVRVPKRTPAGDYRGAIRFSADGKTLAEVPLVVHVWNFELPDESHVKAVYDVRLSQPWVEGAGSKERAYEEVSRFMAERRLSPDRIEPEPVLKYEGGRVVADFSKYDAAAEEYFNRRHHNHTYTPSAFYVFGWAHPPARRFGQEPYEGKFPYPGVDRGKLRPEYKRAYQECLRVYLDHMRERGWYEKVLLYVSDEPHFWRGSGRNKEIIAQMKAVCDMIHEVDSKIPIYSSTWHHVPEWDGYVTAWGIGAYGVVPPDKIDELKRGGARVLWTTDGHMCIDTPYCAIERLLPHYCFRYGVEGYEFWGATWLTYDPYRFGWHRFIRQADEPGHDYYVRYPNGDGYLMYPGAAGKDPVSSIRLEQAREGVEDYEYLWLLRNRAERAKAAGKDAGEAEAVLSEANELVNIPNAGGRYSTKILPRPDAVGEVRQRVAETIEKLGPMDSK